MVKRREYQRNFLMTDMRNPDNIYLLKSLPSFPGWFGTVFTIEPHAPERFYRLLVIEEAPDDQFGVETAGQIEEPGNEFILL